MNLDVKDEILAGEPKYRIMQNDTILYDDVAIEMTTEVQQQGTPLNKALFDALIQQINYAYENKYILGTFTWSKTETTTISCGFKPKVVIIQFAKVDYIVDGGGIIILVNGKGTVLNTYNHYNSTIGGGPVTSNFTETGFDLGAVSSVTRCEDYSPLCNYIAFR